MAKKPSLHLMEKMERRYTNASLALSIELFLSQQTAWLPKDILSESNEINALRNRVRTKISRLSVSSEFKDNALVATERYLKQIIESRKIESELEQILTKNNNTFDSDTAGFLLFFLRTIKNPESDIIAKRHEAYWLMEFKSDNDRRQFNAGLNDPHTVEPSGGNYYRSLKLLALSIPIKVMTIPMGQAHPGEFVFIHEKQHFINDTAFSLFSGYESSDYDSGKDILPFLEDKLYWSESKDEMKEHLRAIKDEVIAYIRSGGFQAQILYQKLYDHLFNHFSDDENHEIRSLLDDIEKQYKALHPFIINQNLRAIITYMLIDVPLTRFPEKLIQIRRYLKITENTRKGIQTLFSAISKKTV